MTLSFAPLPCPDSPLRRIDPRWKLAGILVALLGIALLRELPTAGAGLVLALALAAAARMPARWYLWRIAPLGLFVVFFVVSFPLLAHDGVPWFEIGGLSVSWSGMRSALLIAAQAVALVTLALVVLVSAPLNQALTAAHALRVPGLLIQITLLAYQYLHVLTGEARRLRIALRVRGYRNRMTAHSYRTIAHVAGALLVRGHDRAERVAQAMRCRGFDGRFRCLESFRARWSDVASFAAMVGIVAVLVILDRWS